MEAAFNAKQIRINLDRLPFPEVTSVFSAEFRQVEAGWQPVVLSTGKQRTAFSASHLYDPFPEIIAWLEVVARGGARRVKIDLEGVDLYLLASDVPDHLLVRITVAWTESQSSAPVVDMDFVAPRKEFCRRFYRAFRTHVESDRWDSQEWVACTMERDVSQRGLEILPEELASLDAATLNELLWKLYPSYHLLFSSTPDPGTQVARFAQYALSGKRPPDFIEIPTPLFFVPIEFDLCTAEERTAEIRELLSEQVNSWHGTDLTLLHSAFLDRL